MLLTKQQKNSATIFFIVLQCHPQASIIYKADADFMHQFDVGSAEDKARFSGNYISKNNRKWKDNSIVKAFIAR